MTRNGILDSSFLCGFVVGSDGGTFIFGKLFPVSNFKNGLKKGIIISVDLSRVVSVYSSAF